MPRQIASLIATFFYLGYAPLAPGTLGSLGAIIIFVLLQHFFPVYLTVMLVLFWLGLWSSKIEIENRGCPDPPQIVIDEVCGMLLTYFLVPYHFLSLLVGFFVFRVLDISKPFPIKASQKLPGEWGVMVDDLIAALYSNLILQFIFRYICKQS